MDLRRVLTILSLARKKSISQIYRECKMGYCTILQIIKVLERGGFVKTKKKGRIKCVCITEEGEILKEMLGRLVE